MRRGVVGETKRVCHVVPIPEPAAVPTELTALCGERIHPGQAELLRSISGMPCQSCLVVAARRMPVELTRTAS
jgi:hypothetical protein